MPEAQTQAAPVTAPKNPFAVPVFAVLWTATVLSNVGTWIHDMGASWLMTSLSPSPLVVAMVQTATLLPLFLFAIPAGALADMVDRRKLLLSAQIVMMLLALALAYVTHRGWTSVPVLLLFTFLMGSGAAITAPAWQAIVPSLVPKPVLGQAIAMNSMGINVSRAIGPAVAGVLIVAAGVAMPFLVNSLTFLAVILALLWWKPPVKAKPKSGRESLRGAMVAGLRYAIFSPALRSTLVRAAGFFLFASAFWSLLPLVSKQLLNGDANLFGNMMGAVGAGAVAGALLMPKIRALAGPDALVALGSVLAAIVMSALVLVKSDVLALGLCVFMGLAWIIVLTHLNLSAQAAVADWVRARGLSIFVTVFFGAMSFGSLLWGQLASSTDIPTAMWVASAALVIVIPITWRWKLLMGQGQSYQPSGHWPAPVVNVDDVHGKGPVMISIDYRVPDNHREKFVTLMYLLGETRRRDGSYQWLLFRDTEAPEVFHEQFMVSTWDEHMRQHDRVTVEEQQLQQQIRQLCVEGEAPKVRHWLASHP